MTVAWTSPMTYTAGATLTAAQLNTYLRDNLNETAVAKATTAGSLFVATGLNAIAERIPAVNLVSTSETTTSTSYGNLTTSGPSVTCTTSTKALVIVSAQAANNTGGNSSYMSWKVTGATTAASADTWALEFRDAGTTGLMNASRAHLEASLTAGSNVFTAEYRVSGGTGTFQRRHIVVIPF